MARMTFEELAPELIGAGERIGALLAPEYERLLARGVIVLPETPQRPLTASGWFGEVDRRYGGAPIKYAINARARVTLMGSYLPYFEGVSAAYELGVGPGYLFRGLQDCCGIRMRGCDVPTEHLDVYAAFREALGISHLVDEHRVAHGEDIPIPAGTEALVAFWSVFDIGWTLEEHEWFLDLCRAKLTGARRVFWRFNKRHRRERGTLDFYRARGAFPHPQDDLFCILDL